ncbi:Retinoblastoma-associated protein [Branchiostoma belcheri]|nr:Retinoblastoma-associated protein [Branchiostoma belcheri]
MAFESGLTVAYLLLGLVIIIVNAAVLWGIIRTQELHKAHYFYMANVAASDILTGVGLLYQAVDLYLYLVAELTKPDNTMNSRTVLQYSQVMSASALALLSVNSYVASRGFGQVGGAVSVQHNNLGHHGAGQNLPHNTAQDEARRKFRKSVHKARTVMIHVVVAFVFWLFPIVLLFICTKVETCLVGSWPYLIALVMTLNSLINPVSSIVRTPELRKGIWQSVAAIPQAFIAVTRRNDVDPQGRLGNVSNQPDNAAGVSEQNVPLGGSTTVNSVTVRQGGPGDHSLYGLAVECFGPQPRNSKRALGRRLGRRAQEIEASSFYIQDKEAHPIYDNTMELGIVLTITWWTTGLVIISLNLAVLWGIFRSQKLRTAHDIFMANVATSDLLTGIGVLYRVESQAEEDKVDTINPVASIVRMPELRKGLWQSVMAIPGAFVAMRGGNNVDPKDGPGNASQKSVADRIDQNVLEPESTTVYSVTVRQGGGSPLYEAILTSEMPRPSFQTSPGSRVTNGSIPHSSTASEMYLSPTRFSAAQQSPYRSPGSASSRLHCRSPGPHRRKSQSLQLFYNKVCKLAYMRLQSLCKLLCVSAEMEHRIWTALEFCLLHRPELLKNRHLDQIVMCSVYAICKVSGCDTKFKSIVAAYKNLPTASQTVYKEAWISGEEYDSIIGFYNRVYMQTLKNYILRFTSPDVVVGDSEGWAPPSNNDTQDEHVGRTYCTCAEPRIFAFCMPQLSPLPCKSPSRFSQSPVITVPGRSNFYISPLRESPFSSPVRRELLSPGQMTPRTRALYSFGEGLGSSEKLRAINESMRAAAAGKRTSPGQPRSQKRLKFDADSTDTNGTTTKSSTTNGHGVSNGNSSEHGNGTAADLTSVTRSAWSLSTAKSPIKITRQSPKK